MARKRASRQVDGGRPAPDPAEGPGIEVEAVLAAARAEIGGLGKGARRRLARVERKLGAALRMEAKRRRKLGEALGEVAGLVARVQEIVRPGEAGAPTASDAPAGEADVKKARKRTSPKASAATKATSAAAAAKENPKPTAKTEPAARPGPAPNRRVARRPGPDAGSRS
jgi:hypothetical protein